MKCDGRKLWQHAVVIVERKSTVLGPTYDLRRVLKIMKMC